MRTLAFSDARNNLKDLLDRVTEDHVATIIKRRDAEDAVVMSLSDYNAMQETMYLLSTPANARYLMGSIAQLRTGKSRARKLIEPTAD
ncbi:MAG: type II toxin-antitoxin system prevent-host-death family antitoxin [Lysobacterales bacterium]